MRNVPRLSCSTVLDSSLPMSTYPVLRSTRLTMQCWLPLPITVSISQWPSWRRACTLPGRGDVPFAGQFSPAVVAPVALAAILARPARMQIQTAPAGFVVPDMPVDRLMTDAQPTVPAQMPRHLLRTPLLAQQSVHTLQILQGEVQVAPRPG